jgi:hypothetical protein
MRLFESNTAIPPKSCNLIILSNPGPAVRILHINTQKILQSYHPFHPCPAVRNQQNPVHQGPAIPLLKTLHLMPPPKQSSTNKQRNERI